MRAITKLAEPRELIKWKTANFATPQNLFYGGGGFPGEAVRKALLLEQFHLCAYTMKRLTTIEDCEHVIGDSCHIEPVLPQARKIPSETIDYQNMVACYPPSKTMAACEYGAHAKADYDPANEPFVSPLRTDAEQHFRFLDDGSVEGTTDQGIATVKVLKLDHHALVNDRAAAIRGFLYPRKRTAISAATARRIADEVLKPDANRCLHPYCVAIAAAASRHADRAEGKAARIKGKSRN